MFEAIAACTWPCVFVASFFMLLVLLVAFVIFGFLGSLVFGFRVSWFSFPWHLVLSFFGPLVRMWFGAAGLPFSARHRHKKSITFPCAVCVCVAALHSALHWLCSVNLWVIFAVSLVLDFSGFCGFRLLVVCAALV